MWNEQILSGIGEDPDKPKIFTKKNVRNHSYHKFYPVLAKIRINRVLLYFISHYYIDVFVIFLLNSTKTNDFKAYKI